MINKRNFHVVHAIINEMSKYGLVTFSGRPRVYRFVNGWDSFQVEVYSAILDYDA